MTRKQDRKQAGIGLTLCALLTSGTALAQQVSSQNFGLSTGVVFNDNRGLDNPSAGDTTELFSRLDFNIVESDALQSLSLNGDVTLRGLNGAEEDVLPEGLVEPRLRLNYSRAVRDAELLFTVFGRETETGTLVEEFDGLDLTQINETATRLAFGFDTSLEIGRTAPFGVTFSAGYTGLRYSDTTSTTLLDQDRTRLGADFRFDINSVLQANVDTRYSTFEEDGTSDGVRETFDLSASLDRALEVGSFGIIAGFTHVEEGERYGLGVSRSIEGPLWEIGGRLGLEQSVSGDTFPSGSLDVAHILQNGTVRLNIGQGLRSGIDDDEEEFTSARFNYTRDLSAQSAMGFSASYQKNDPTGTLRSTSFGTIGLNYQRALPSDWTMNMGVDRRVTTNSAGTTARDNRLSFSMRRELNVGR